VMTYVSAYYHAFADVYKVFIKNWFAVRMSVSFLSFLNAWFVYVYVLIEINNSIKADEKVVMTYVSSYYHAFSTTQKVGIFSMNIRQKKWWWFFLMIKFCLFV
jgi:hypothetical protein